MYAGSLCPHPSSIEYYPGGVYMSREMFHLLVLVKRQEECVQGHQSL